MAQNHYQEPEPEGDYLDLNKINPLKKLEDTNSLLEFLLINIY